MNDKPSNPDYPPDYGDYLALCYDDVLGETRISYEEWKARSAAIDEMVAESEKLNMP